MKNLPFASALFAIILSSFSALAHGDEHDPDVEIHTFENGETYTSCSFFVHSSLTQSELHRFTKEAGNIVYFNPLNGASTLGKWNFDISLTMTRTPIDQTSGAWNNTFAHPKTDINERPHFLGDQIQIPILRFALGITEHIDGEIYITKDFGANYGLMGFAMKYGKEISENKKLYGAARLSHSMIYGPKEINVNSTGLDLLFSKKWKYFEPYVGANISLNSAKETTDKVNLKVEHILTPKAVAGVRANYKFLSAAAEYDFGVVNTFSLRLGVRF